MKHTLNFAKSITLTTLMSGALIVSNLASAGESSQIDEADKMEKRGALVGMTLGAMTGGPVGAGIGTIIGGGFIGKWLDTSKQNKRLNADYVALQSAYHQERTRFRNENANYLAEVSRLQRALSHAREVDNVRISGAAPDLPIQFKTGSAELEPHYQAQLAEMATTLSSKPHLSISLSGFADRRGDENYNLSLSKRRVNQVKAFLVSHGVEAAQIKTDAFGEARPLHEEESYENHFFDRRVVMEIRTAEEAPVAIR